MHKLKGFLERKQMLDVKIVTGPIYWTHNQTFVPTTTTTTSTTTTTEPTTTSQKAKPLESPIDMADNEVPLDDAPNEEDIVKVSGMGLGSSQTTQSGKKHEDNKKDGQNASNSLIGSLVVMATGSLLSVFVV